MTAKPNDTGLPADTLLALYRGMLELRLYEEKVVALYPEQEMQTPVHLYLGEEAVATGVCAHLGQRDMICSNHRSHGHYLAKGGDMYRLTAELYGRRDGCSAGKGGSMHVVDPEAGVNGSSAIVGGGIPLAVGTALAFSIRKQKQVSVAFFGDGAVDEGTFHESLNFAALKKLPVVFVCENNLYATCSHREKRQAFSSIADLAAGYGMPARRIDGNDVLAVFEAAGTLVENARTGQGPAFLECRTYRWKGHVGPDCDISMGYRCQTELDSWQNRCPVQKFEKILRDQNLLTDATINEMRAEIDQVINQAFQKAKGSPYPDPQDLYLHVEG